MIPEEVLPELLLPELVLPELALPVDPPGPIAVPEEEELPEEELPDVEAPGPDVWPLPVELPVDGETTVVVPLPFPFAIEI